MSEKDHQETADDPSAEGTPDGEAGLRAPDRGSKPGPKPERLVLEYGDWREAVKEALETSRPERGWPWEEGGRNGSD